MGKTGSLGPAVNVPLDETVKQAGLVEKESVTLQGADLYRLNCRGCHGEFGLGAPPEINSVIDPVRSSSAVLVMERMKKLGMDMKPSEAAQLAKQSQNALLLRLHNGGHDMPAFSHLNDEEIRALMGYLRELADVPGVGSRQLAVQETPVRIGEHIVKSTCHTCHAASGTDPDAQQLADGAIPPLSTLTNRVSKAQFIRKVTQGATIEMGTPALAYRGRMPVFYYLSKEEAADAYLYLTHYASHEDGTHDPVVDMASDGPGPSDPDSQNTNSRANTNASANDARSPDGKENKTAGMQPIILAILAGGLVSLLLIGMAAFTVRECMRLSRTEQRPARKTGYRQAANPITERLESQRIA